MDSLSSLLKDDRLLLGCCIMYPAPGIIELIGQEWDWIWLDAQHGQHDYESVLGCVRVCEIKGAHSVIRVPSHDYGAIGYALDTNTGGVMVPMVNTAEQAQKIVMAAKFPPLGSRSFGGRRPIDLIGRSYAHSANSEKILIAQIETEEGLANVNQIAAVSGIDVLFFSPDDMAMQIGLPMDQKRENSLFHSGMKKLADAALNAGKAAGTVTANPELLELALKLGYRLCVGSSDASILLQGSRQARKNLSSKLNDNIPRNK